MKNNFPSFTILIISSLLISLGVFACSSGPSVPSDEDQHHDANQSTQAGEAYLSHPGDLSAVNLTDEDRLVIVATTTIAADIVSNIGVDQIDLIGLFPLGSDPHTYEPTPADYQTMVNADVILINGVGLEEFLEPTLEQISSDTPIVSLSADIDLLEFGETSHAHDSEEEEHTEEEAEEGHDHDTGYDPHVWFDPNNIKLWAGTIVDVLSTLDPDNADVYRANSEAYNEQLTELDLWIEGQVDQIPPENRELVTDHQAFSYFTARYDLIMIGAVIPAYSTSADPSAQELAVLEDSIRELDVKAVFVGTSANPTLAEQAARDTGVQLLPLFTGSLSDSSGPAATYLELMHYNVNSIVDGLSGS